MGLKDGFGLNGGGNGGGGGGGNTIARVVTATSNNQSAFTITGLTNASTIAGVFINKQIGIAPSGFSSSGSTLTITDPDVLDSIIIGTKIRVYFT